MTPIPSQFVRDLSTCNGKFDLIHQMVSWLESAGYTKDELKEIESSVIEREMIMSTSLGFMLALPHAKSPKVKQTHILVCRLLQGVDFDALDGLEARIIFLVLSPISDHKNHIKTISTISRYLNVDGKVDGLLALEDFTQIIKDLEAVL
jgi:mannitol/fructose-specific phosphotransferase system IIA component (Ntr-type)